MPFRTRLMLVGVCALGLGLLAEPYIYAQDSVCRGKVKLIASNTEATPEPNLSVCAIRQEDYNQNKFPCYDQKNTDAKGEFEVVLRPDTYVFLVVNPPENYTQKPVPFVAFAVANLKDKIIPDSASTLTKNDKQSRANPAVPQIVLALYRVAATQGHTETILKGNVVGAQRRGLVGANVFVSRVGGVTTELIAKDQAKEHGAFEISIPPRKKSGIYIFSVTAPGFRPYIGSLDAVFEDLTKPNAADRNIHEFKSPIQLKRMDDLVERKDSLIEPVEASLRHVFLPEVMQTLPLPGTRSFDEFALLAPGVLPPPETFGKFGPGVSAGIGTAGQFSINGLRSRENNFTIDGSDNNDDDIGTRRQGFIMTVPQPVESVKELQVITLLADTRFGRNIAGQINVLTKTGAAGNFHGTFYSYISDTRLNSRGPFDQSNVTSSLALRRASDGAPVLFDGAPLVRPSQTGGEDQSTRLQIGIAAGGQLTKDNDTSYFVSLERQDLRADRESHFAVPTAKQRGAFDSGDTGLLLVTAPNVKTPLYPASVPGNAILSLFPFPNNPVGPYGENTYSTVLPADGHGWRSSVKLARDFEGDPPKGRWFPNILTFRPHIDQITGRYNFSWELTTLPVTGGALFSSLRPRVRTQNFAAFVNRTLSASTSDSIRFSVGNTKLSFAERRDGSMLPSTALPGTPFLLNAPLVLNVTKPNADGSLNAPSFVSAAGPAGSALLASLGYQGATQTEQITGPLGQVLVAGFSPIGVDVENFPQTRSNKTFQFADTITSTRNSHIFTYGMDFRKPRINSTLDRNFRPRATFNSLPSGPFANTIELAGSGPAQARTLTGLTLAAAGVPTGLFQTLATVADSSAGLRHTQVNVFFQDQWRLRPNFYLTAGLRYEVNTVPDTVNRRLEDAFNPEELKTLVEQAAGSCQPIARCSDLVSAFTTAFPANFKASFGTDRNDFDPRVGFAWTLRDNTVFRAGFGSYSGNFPDFVLNQVRNAFPTFLPLNVANFTPRSGDRTYLFNLASPAVQQLLASPGGVAPGTLNQISTTNSVGFLVNQIFNLQNVSLAPTVLGFDPILPQPNLKPPYSLHYAFTVEHEFQKDFMLSAAYVGTHGHGLLRLATPDLGLNDTRFAGNIVTSPLTGSAPFPYFQGQILPAQTKIISNSFTIARTFFESTATSTFNSLQLEFRKRYSKGFLIGSAFTYSHSVDDASDFFDIAGAFSLPQNSVIRSERGSSNYDVRIRSATHFVMDVQREWIGRASWEGKKKGWLRTVLGNLQLAGIFTAQGGQPYTVNSSLDVNRDGNLTDRLNTVQGLIDESTNNRVQLQLNPDVNARDLLAADGFDGAIGRNTFRAPQVYNVDLAITGAIPVEGNRRFLVRAEFLNLLNFANYGIPDRILESPGFGTAKSTLVSPRMVQFVGKFQF